MYVPTIAHNPQCLANTLKTCKLHQAVLQCKSTYLDYGGVAGIYPTAGSSPFYKKFLGGSSHAGIQTLISWSQDHQALFGFTFAERDHCRARPNSYTARLFGEKEAATGFKIAQESWNLCHHSVMSILSSLPLFLSLCVSPSLFLFLCVSVCPFFCDLLFVRPFGFVLVLFSCSSQFPIWKGALPSNAEHLGGSRECQNSQISPPKISSPPDLFISL